MTEKVEGPINLPEPNQLYRDLMGIIGLNSFKGGISASREQMFSSHIGQCLVTNGLMERYIQTGMEREYAKYTFNVKMPHDGRIIKVIERYSSRVWGQDAIKFNPQTIAIFERLDNKEVGVIDLRRYGTQHQYFGFEYKPKSAAAKLIPGTDVEENEIFLDSPSVSDNGVWRFGRQLNIAYMSHPAVSEDGILISKQALEHFKFKTYETRIVEWGKDRFPLNLYGDEKNYKPFPDIGDYIRDDGLLMVTRTYDEDLAVVEQSTQDLMEPDLIFDKATYGEGPGGRIVDIRIHHMTNNPYSQSSESMQAQPLKYDRARRQFYKEIYDEYMRLKRERGPALRLSPEFHRMVVEAISVVGRNTMAPNEPIKMLYRQNNLDEYRVEFVIEYENTPGVGFKLTNTYGGKGVCVKVVDESELPIDEEGNRADIVMDGYSVGARMNTAALYEQYINSASRDVAKRIRKRLGLENPMMLREAEKILLQMEIDNPALFNEVWDYLLGYYQIVTPRQYGWFVTGQITDRAHHLATVIVDHIYLYMPPDNEPEYTDIIRQIETKYRPLNGPVSYIGNSGRRVTTKKNVRIGSMYFMLLEKTGDDWTAVSSGKLQHFGVLSQVTNADKYSEPSRNQAVRALGEAEVRIYAAYPGPEITADILDRNNNPYTHKAMLQTILQADKPTALKHVVDRKKVPIGGSKPIRLVEHVLQCAGLEFVYEPNK